MTKYAESVGLGWSGNDHRLVIMFVPAVMSIALLDQSAKSFVTLGAAMVLTRLSALLKRAGMLSRFITGKLSCVESDHHLRFIVH
eukprot:3907105-Amphidinium_carterae.1